ncbi:hypothetical protein [Methylovulum psychrotolerans]|uniref:Uncharacterized protein n=1 Tax=Methylovulum psychrotolerans TaxID=1704499 RepID=A0A1Z4C1T9_9GAMM|nr:hypothetical protein [Methylovulum psychrotolerans]ASF47497.1 hypothetical protein CEK71_16305 [Methylovulum psychrotolerans]
MTENVLIALIIGSVVVITFALWMFRDKLGMFSFTANKKSVSAKMERAQNTGITISGNTQNGNDNEISAETANATIDNNSQQGNENRIRAATPNKKP